MFRLLDGPARFEDIPLGMKTRARPSAQLRDRDAVAAFVRSGGCELGYVGDSFEYRRTASRSAPVPRPWTMESSARPTQAARSSASTRRSSARRPADRAGRSAPRRPPRRSPLRVRAPRAPANPRPLPCGTRPRIPQRRSRVARDEQPRAADPHGGPAAAIRQRLQAADTGPGDPHRVPGPAPPPVDRGRLTILRAFARLRRRGPGLPARCAGAAPAPLPRAWRCRPAAGRG